MTTRVRVYIACSIDGFIAGEGDDISWLPEPAATDDGEPDYHDFTEFYGTIGAVLMGRRTYDLVLGFGEDMWLYGDTPMLIATNRPLTSSRASVRGIGGTIEELVAAAREDAGDKDVYIDGGILIRQALDAKLIDHITLNIVPVLSS